MNDPGKSRTGGRPKQDAPPPPERERLSLVPDRLRFHDLRHTAASLLLSQGQSLRAVSQRLGHSTPSVTLNIYAHVLPGDEKLSDGMRRVLG